MVTPKDVTLITNVSKCSCKGLTSNALPEVSSPADRIELDNGVSTQNVSTITPQNVEQKKTYHNGMHFVVLTDKRKKHMNI